MYYHSLKRLLLIRVLALTLLALSSGSALSDQAQSLAESVRYEQLRLTVPERKTEVPRWYISFDNDFFAPKNRDQDYTYGLNLAYASSEIDHWWVSRVLYALDRELGFNESTATRGHSLEFGLYGFTPSNVSSEALSYDDRPYSSLVYSSVTAERLNWSNRSVIRTQLTVGALGLDWVGDLQNMTHRFSDSQEALGWDHQISAGGEPTFRYSVARSKLLTKPDSPVEARHTVSGSVGYITEVDWSIGLRAGKIHTPWYSFKPEVKNYAESTASKRIKVPESYFWLGGALKLRGYNAFLQGQFKSSELEYDYDELRPLVLELWVGYTHEFVGGYHINYALRGHTSEIKDGDGDRNMLWGGIILGKNMGSG